MEAIRSKPASSRIPGDPHRKGSGGEGWEEEAEEEEEEAEAVRV
jgi:hypothetical protein